MAVESDAQPGAHEGGVALVVVDAGGRVSFCNPAFALALGVGGGVAGVLGRRLVDGHAEPGPAAAVADDETLAVDGEVLARIEWSEGFGDVRIGAFPRREAPPAAGGGYVVDELTGLQTRGGFVARFEALQAAIDHASEQVVVMALDLDRFKVINDALGHAAGDRLLRKVVGRLRHTIRRDDAVFRLGGDEFAIVLSAPVGKRIADQLADRIIDVLSRPYVVDGREANIGVSIGLCRAEPQADSAEEVLRRADIALYRGKAAGKGRQVWFTSEMAEEVRRRREFELDFRKALVLGQLELSASPHTGDAGAGDDGGATLCTVGVRWQHPRYGAVDPDRLVAVACDTLLAHSLLDWILRTLAALDPRELQAHEFLVPLSATQFLDPRCHEVLESHARRCAPLKRHVVFEVEEAALVRAGDDGGACLERIHRTGFRLALDGTTRGLIPLSCRYSPLFRYLVLSDSLVDALAEQPHARGALAALAAWGDALGAALLAKDVASPEQTADVRRYGGPGVRALRAGTPGRLGAPASSHRPATQSTQEEE